MVSKRPLAVVTEASFGIGYELARCCARKGFDLVIAADEPEIHDAANKLRKFCFQVDAVEADLGTFNGVDHLYTAIQHRPVDALLANAGHGLGDGFLDQDLDAWTHVVNANITGTLYLIQIIARDMRNLGRGRILITGSIEEFMPRTYRAVYNGTKAFLDTFSFALRHELKSSGITVTCLMPGMTETEFFERTDMIDTKVGQSKKEDPVWAAQEGVEAMMNGEGEVISNWQNKLRTAISSILPADMTAEMYQKNTAFDAANNSVTQQR